MAAAGWTVTRARIEEHVIPGKRLGRHVEHDSRSLAYRHHRTGITPVSVLHDRRIPILDQGDVGSCTGNAQTGALGTDPLRDTLPAGTVLDEKEALRLYSAAETIDGDGPYPPQDNGSSGLSVCKAAKKAGLISGYTHLMSLADLLDALAGAPVIVGVNWYDSFDEPPQSGLVAISPGAQVRGGHEVVIRGCDVGHKLLYADNSWGIDWGAGGSFSLSWDTMTRLLAEDGDGTVSVPLTAPAPVPVPPAPGPPPSAQKLWTAAQTALKAFAAAEGLS